MPKNRRRPDYPFKKPKKKPKKHAHKKPVLCPYCGAQALLKDGSFLFGENPFVKNVFICVRYPDCDSYVQAHESNLEPMGTLANATLRKKRMVTHMYFDKLWNAPKGKSSVFTRNQAYKWLCDKVGGQVHHSRNHIAGMDEFLCDRVIKEVKRILWIQKQKEGTEGRGEDSG